MTYDVVARFSQVTSLLLFLGMFLAVLVYAFWPSNRRLFDELQKQALDLDADKSKSGVKS